MIDEVLAEDLGLATERASAHQVHLEQAIAGHLVARRERDVVVLRAVDVRDTAIVDVDLDLGAQARKLVVGQDGLVALVGLAIVALAGGHEESGQGKVSGCAAKHERA